MDHLIDIHTSPRTSVPLSRKQKIKEFWRHRQEEIEKIDNFSERAIPISRMKKLIRTAKGKMLMACDTPSFMTKACELFVQELAFRAWMCAESNNRHVILDSDIAEAISSTGSYAFLNDVLHVFEEEKNSIPHAKPTKKHHQLNQQSTYHPPSYPVPSFSPKFNGYPPYVGTSLSMPPTNVCPNPLDFSFLPRDECSLMDTAVMPGPGFTGIIPPNSYMGSDPWFFGNNLNTSIDSNVTSNFCVSNNVVASSAMSLSHQVYSGVMPEISDISLYMNMTNPSGATYRGGGTGANDIAAQNGYVTIESNQILPGRVESGSHDNIHVNNTICDDDGVQQHQELNVVDECLEAIAAAGTGESGDNRNINFDEFDIADDSWLTNILEDFMIEDPTSFSDPTSTNCHSQTRDTECEGI